MADPDFELRRGSGSILLAQPAFLPSVISSFFTQNKGGSGRAPQAPPLDPPLVCVVRCSLRINMSLPSSEWKNGLKKLFVK